MCFGRDTSAGAVTSHTYIVLRVYDKNHVIRTYNTYMHVYVCIRAYIGGGVQPTHETFALPARERIHVAHTRYTYNTYVRVYEVPGTLIIGTVKYLNFKLCSVSISMAPNVFWNIRNIILLL